MLVLDEPTNDLDLVTLNVLERLLRELTGAVLLVTHDRYFLDKVATALLVFEGEGRVVRHEGNSDHYRRVARQQKVSPPPSRNMSTAFPHGAPGGPREDSRASRGL